MASRPVLHSCRPLWSLWSVIAASLVVASACDRTATRSKATQPPTLATSEIEQASLRQENEALRRRMQLLEEQMRLLKPPRGDGEKDTLSTAADERGPNAPDGHAKALPVVRLTPASSAAKAREGEPAAPTKGPRRRDAVSLDPLPYSSPESLDFDLEVDDGAAMPEPSAAPSSRDDSNVDASASGGTIRQFRIIGQEHADQGHADIARQTRQARQSVQPSVARSPDPSEIDAGVLQSYRSAMALYQKGDLVAAESAFAVIARAHPDHEYADNALYWQGESLYDQGQYGAALAVFTSLIDRYATGNKAPDALLKIGLCYLKLGDADNAQQVLSRVIAAFPKSQASRVSRQKLEDLRRKDRS